MSHVTSVQRRPMASSRRDTDFELKDLEAQSSRDISRAGTDATVAEPLDLEGRIEEEIREIEEEVAGKVKYAWDRFKGKGVKLPTLRQSLWHIATHSILNVLFIFVPIAWVGHFLMTPGEDPEPVFKPIAQFVISFLAIIPLEKMFDELGEEMAIYVGAELGDLLNITLNNSVEAALAIFLLTKDHFRLLQATIVGVVLLHLLLLPGVSFLTGGARIIEQELAHHSNELNHSLLTLGVMTLVLPATFFAALDRGNLHDLTQVVLSLNGTTQNSTGIESEDELLRPLLSDDMRGRFLSISRGLSILLLAAYVCSRFYLHNPPGKGNALQMTKSQSEAHMKAALEKESAEPHIGPFVGVVAILVFVGIMAATAEWLVDSIEDVQDTTHIGPEWFGLFLLPIISFSGDGLLAILWFLKKIFLAKPGEPDSLAQGLAIDLSIQFLLFWMPFLVIVGWWANKPFSLLFDLLEVVILVAAAFLTNYVTADSKTNWVEGFCMVAFYIMIAIAAWFYPGQIEVRMFVSSESVANAVASGGPIN